MGNSDHYTILGLRPGASDDQVRKAFRRLALIHHPDKNPGDAQAAGRFRRIAEAYRVLGDAKRRLAYDRSGAGIVEDGTVADHYLRVDLDKSSLALNGELLMTVFFPSEGRAFRKPALDGWEITAGPAVSHRLQNGIRETVLQYTLCPLRTGRLVVPSSRIHFFGKAVVSEPLAVEVTANTCWFTATGTAGEKPLRLQLNKLHEIRTSRFTKTVVVPRTVLVPRSDLAAFYHRVGRILKITVPLFCGPMAVLEGWPLLYGLLAGSLFAGLNVRLMYRLMGVKPVSGYAAVYPQVANRLDEGYFFGNTPPLLSGKAGLSLVRLRDWLL